MGTRSSINIVLLVTHNEVHNTSLLPDCSPFPSASMCTLSKNSKRSLCKTNSMGYRRMPPNNTSILRMYTDISATGRLCDWVRVSYLTPELQSVRIKKYTSSLTTYLQKGRKTTACSIMQEITCATFPPNVQPNDLAPKIILGLS